MQIPGSPVSEVVDLGLSDSDAAFGPYKDSQPQRPSKQPDLS